MTILQAYNGDADAVSMLDELNSCSRKLLGQRKSKSAETQQAADVLLEILLSFSSKPSLVLRKTSEQVFGAFADQITPSGLESLLAVRTIHL
jgi:DNA polymerase phi